jgi:predicted nucleic acid-binding protein
VILVDTNILIYAIDQDSPHHARARRWLEETLSGDAWIGLPWIVILAFIRGHDSLGDHAKPALA